MWYFWAKKLMKIWYLLITEKFSFWSFRKWEIRSFFESKSWWKDDICWLPKVLILDFSVMGNTVFFWGWWENTVFFWVKKLMERSYLLVTETFLFWTFRWWEIRSLFQSKRWWKDDIYLVFSSFPWYSRTWEIWFSCSVPCITLFIFLSP